jgi:DNA repair exonuclease SbcCD ATPase subunit
MLTNLEYAVEFPSTGRSFQNRIEFEPGLTAITGRNEAGKSLVLEMIGYCLFGKAALRGAAADYRNLTAELALTLGDQNIRIERRPRSEALKVDGDIKAVGADAINRAVPKLLGFGLDVFNVACAAQQGDIEALTNMRPTARKAMIDQLIGLDRLEEIERECRSQSKAHATAAEALLLGATPPTIPVQPDDYAPSETLALELEALQGLHAERAQLLQVREPEAPKVPAAPSETDVEMLEAHEAKRQDALRDQARLMGTLSAIPSVTVDADTLAKAIAYANYTEEVARRGPRPEYSAEGLHQMRLIWEAKNEEDPGEVECPDCGAHFAPGWSDAALALRNAPTPILTERQVADQQQRRLIWDHRAPLAEVEPCELPNLPKETTAHELAHDRTRLEAELAALVIPDDRAGDLRAARNYRSEQAVYAANARVYDSQCHDYERAQARLADLPDRQDDIADVQRRAGDARSYESAYGRYCDDVTRYEAALAHVARERDTSEGFLSGSDALRAARVRVKAELAPSLSRAASSLVSMMTSGERTQIVVDEDFDIMVDGQPLATLSGSGKAVANLALRIGLGQVITAKVLPIFLGDEIDASLDNDRAGATHQTLQTLKNFPKQIIIVSHKADVQADNRIQI